ncbi:MAG: 2-oxoacid:acceptor oxidoreductase subunit alpha [Sphingomonadales bacterium]|nr:2-oxoacid:acceptor oxidoreductase subunit alpha [Sphingomonadales bacterium]
MPANSQQGTQSVSVALVGSGGAGVMTAGTILLDAAAKAGWYGLMTRSVGPQIRGGESAALLRLSTAPVECHGDSFDVLIAVDWQNFTRFAKEVPLSAHSVVLADPAAGAPPAAVADIGLQIVDVPMQELLKKIAGGRPNMLALGLAAMVLGIPEDVVAKVVERRLGKKGGEALDSSLQSVAAGRAAAPGLDGRFALAPAADATAPRWLMSGNQAAGLGALRGGVRFVAAYPITPATEVLEWMAPRLTKLGGALVQAEDELASINMIIGSSFSGVPSLTATSGPGYSLMSESIGLAVAAEVPIVVVNVMRGGPSTGIATKSEQADLNIAVYGLHGDAPHVVVAPTSIGDCAVTSQWAVHLAEKLQTPAIVLSDQFLGQAQAVLSPPLDTGEGPDRLINAAPMASSARYEVTESGVSPMPVPGVAGGQYISESLTHNIRGRPSTLADDHLAQIEKRQRKLSSFDFGARWADIEGDGPIAIISWGSCCAPIREAMSLLNGGGKDLRFIALRLLSPVQPERMAQALRGVERALIIEQSHSGQLYRYLRAHYDLPKDTMCYHRPGPLAFTPGEIRDQIARMQ